MCQECATEWDGINYCVACLSERRKAVRTSRSFFGWAAVLLASALLFVAGARLMVWAAVFATEFL